MYAEKIQHTEPKVSIRTSVDPYVRMYWEGQGWYAPVHHASYEEGEWFTEEFVSSESERVPELYGTGMGSPTWYDEAPAEI